MQNSVSGDEFFIEKIAEAFDAKPAEYLSQLDYKFSYDDILFSKYQHLLPRVQLTEVVAVQRYDSYHGLVISGIHSCHRSTYTPSILLNSSFFKEKTTMTIEELLTSLRLLDANDTADTIIRCTGILDA